MFDQCQKLYEFSYVDPVYSKMKSKLKNEPKNIWPFNTLGKAVHSAITMFYHSPSAERSLNNLKELLKQTWFSEARWYQKWPLGEWGGFQTIDEEREWYGRALLMLQNFVEMAPMEAEFEFLPTDNFKNSISDYHRLITPLTEDFDISGKFDLVIRNFDGSLDIVDFKTGREEEAKELQLNFYKVLAELKFKKPVKSLYFYFLKTLTKVKIETGDKDQELGKQQVVRKIREIRSTQKFEPKVSKLCKFCLFNNFCPEKESVQKNIQGVEAKDFSEDLPF